MNNTTAAKTQLADYRTVLPGDVKTWVRAGHVDQFCGDAGATILYRGRQVAVFHFTRTDRWYACQNLCPHKLENVLGRGLTGEERGIPKVACPLHKRAFSLEDGSNLNGDCPPLAIYPVRLADDGYVHVGFAD